MPMAKGCAIEDMRYVPGNAFFLRSTDINEESIVITHKPSAITNAEYPNTPKMSLPFIVFVP
jgi:hypothetical protein